MHISIVGCGYVGLVTGACFAEIGHRVVCTDSDSGKIETLGRGELPIYEPGLAEIVSRNVAAGRLSFTADMGEAVRSGETVFICVGTPPLQDGDADLSALDEAARMIVAESCSSKLVVEKSTVPTQTGQKLKKALSIYARNARSQYSFHVASNPEFLREGTAVGDFLHPDRIVIGVEDGSSEQQLRAIYDPILRREFDCPVHNGRCPSKQDPVLVVTSINSAELIKHACNSFLAVKISYANLISDICEATGGDVEQVVMAMGLDPRIGPAFLRPGLGFGGFCLPKDVQAFIKVGERAGVDVSLLRAVEEINAQRIDRLIDKVRHALWIIKNKRIAVLGLAFKPETDDTRFSPGVELIRRLREEGAHIEAYDPQAMEKAKPLEPDLAFADSAYDAADGAEALIIATEWQQFKELDWKRVKELMARPLVLDGRNLLDPDAMVALGFEYHCIGRATEEIASASRRRA